MVAIKTLGNDIVKFKQQLGDIIAQQQVCHLKVGVIIKHIEIFGNCFPCQIFSGEAHHVAKDVRERVEKPIRRSRSVSNFRYGKNKNLIDY